MGMPAAAMTPEGMAMGFPDACKTPVGPVVVPIPYPNMSSNADADPVSTAMTILICGFPGVVLDTEFVVSQGDDAGVLGGLISEEEMGPVTYLLGSTSVIMEGRPAGYFAGLTEHNGLIVANCPIGLQDTPSQEGVLVAP
jgi:ethanolamine transporter EutH